MPVNSEPIFNASVFMSVPACTALAVTSAPFVAILKGIIAACAETHPENSPIFSKPLPRSRSIEVKSRSLHKSSPNPFARFDWMLVGAALITDIRRARTKISMNSYKCTPSFFFPTSSINTLGSVNETGANGCTVTAAEMLESSTLSALIFAIPTFKVSPGLKVGKGVVSDGAIFATCATSSFICDTTICALDPGVGNVCISIQTPIFLSVTSSSSMGFAKFESQPDSNESGLTSKTKRPNLKRSSE
mmetsp:Transcript_117775/g.293698  ORF Transcript_117775/g.293698 Transcript_117775/m.293698 type:complete len:247 (+) Transcript_117775:321-1061(+)